MTSWICPECGRECSLEENGCEACAGPAIGKPVREHQELAELASLTASSHLWPKPSPGAPALDLQSIQILPAQLPNPPSLFVPRLPPTLRVTTTIPPSPPGQVAVPMPVSRQRPLFPSWIVTIVVVSIVSLAIASSVRRFIYPSTEGVGAKTVQRARLERVRPLPVFKPEIAADTETDYPFARFVEVRGLRVVDRNEHSQVQYLVINHSSTQLNDIGLRIEVRSAATSRETGPLFTLAARVPTLGPNESKEMRVDLDSNLRTAQIPDWVNLRTDVRVVSP